MATTQPLVFSDPTNKQGIYEDILFLTGANTVSFPKEDAVRLVNLGLDAVCDLIHTVDSTWTFEDRNNTNLPIGYMDFVANQQDYAISNDFLAIRGVWENTTPGTGSDTWKELVRLDKSVLDSDQNIEPNFLLNSQRGYWIDGNSIYFKPIPTSSTSGNSTTLVGYGFKVLFERAITYVATDATGYIVGYSPLFYRLAALYAAKDYCMVNSLDHTNNILTQIAIYEQRLKQNYGRRNKTQPKRMSVAYTYDK